MCAGGSGSTASVLACRRAPAARFSSAAVEGPQAAVGVVPTVQRRNRLSRSRDFDVVYRQGRSVSTRFLTLYWFQRDESIGAPRLGFAVPKAVGNAVVRNRIKRQLRDIVRNRLEAVPVTNDYVLVVRQGLPEAAESTGTTGSPRASTRCSGRPPRDQRRSQRRGPADPSLPEAHLASSSRRTRASTTRAARSTRRSRSASTASCAGCALAAWRLLRCNPWSHGGVDYP